MKFSRDPEDILHCVVYGLLDTFWREGKEALAFELSMERPACIIPRNRFGPVQTF